MKKEYMWLIGGVALGVIGFIVYEKHTSTDNGKKGLTLNLNSKPKDTSGSAQS